MSGGLIDGLPAEARLPQAPDILDGERHVSEVAGRPGALSRRAGIGVIVAGAAIACGAILLSEAKPRVDAAQAPPLPARAVVSYEPPPAVAPPPPSLPPPLPPPEPPAAAGAATRPGPGAAPPSPASPRLLVYTAGSPARAPQAAGMHAPGSPASPSPGEPESLASRLAPTRLASTSAGLLRNPSHLLTMGSIVPCILQTAMDSTLPGFVTCVVPQDVPGRTGLTLLDRGTRIVGEFRGGVRQGQARLFVVWTRAETPQGVVIELASPATDPLGRSGVEGEVERHFWQRFGGALLLTTVEGAIQAGVAAVSKTGTTTIHTGPAQAVVAEALRGSIALPPTIRKQPGELVSVFVARDLDFSGVYGLQPSGAAAEGSP